MSGAGRAVVLLSGGLDSATVLALARRAGFEAHALTVRYGQRHVVEIERARRVATELGAHEHRVVDLDLSSVGGSALTDSSLAIPRSRSAEQIADGEIPITYVPARNTIFLSLALAWAEVLDASSIFLGVNALDYSGYPDCRPEYLEAFQAMAQLATRAGVEGRGVTIEAPLLQLTKAEIVRKAIDCGVDPAWTVSCYDPSPSGTPCRECDACRLRAKGFQEAGIADPAG